MPGGRCTARQRATRCAACLSPRKFRTGSSAAASCCTSAPRIAWIDINRRPAIQIPCRGAPASIPANAIIESDSGRLRPLARSSTAQVCLAAWLAVSFATPAAAWGKTRLARKYRPGQQLVYQTAVQTSVSISSNPEELKLLLPPLPTSLSSRQQNTITVRSIDASGVAEVENRFDRFEFHSNLVESLPEEMREAAAATQDEFARELSGQTLTARYDRAGRLLGFGGAETALKKLDVPMQETANQILRVFLEQMGGGALYPDHALKEGEEWKLAMDAPSSESFPFTAEGENTLRFVGKTRHGKIKAAIIDIHFTHLLKPSEDSVRRDPAWLQLRARGMGLDITVSGVGKGRVLVALDDGRVLENRTTITQVLRAVMPQSDAIKARANGPLSLQIESETKLQVDEADAPRR